jgi:DNA-binding FrmR family transcriptional regulator
VETTGAGRRRQENRLRFPDDVNEDVQNRLRRLEGQIRGIERMLYEGKDCREVVTQLSAAKSALDRVGYRLVAAALRYCAINPDEAEDDGLTPAELERLFVKLG